MSTRIHRVFGAVLASTLLVVAGPACTSSSPPAAAAAPAPRRAEPAPAPAPAAAPTLTQGLAPIVTRARPAIVTIMVRRPASEDDLSPLAPLLGLLPRGQGGGFAPEMRGEGSGVVVRADGVILTNRHVVNGATQVDVVLTDGRKLTGKVLGFDEPTDIAVVKVATRDLPVVPFGDSSTLQIGDFTLAIGSPFGLGQSVTFGIVSGIGRSGMGLADYEDFIQTDAAINPGNSGGALLDTSGRLIGINTAILSHGAAGNQGVGFAVPVNLAVSVMRQLIAHGRVVRGFLGVSIQDLTPELATGLHLERPGGALLGGVEPRDAGRQGRPPPRRRHRRARRRAGARQPRPARAHRRHGARDRRSPAPPARRPSARHPGHARHPARVAAHRVGLRGAERAGLRPAPDRRDRRRGRPRRGHRRGPAQQPGRRGRPAGRRRGPGESTAAPWPAPAPRSTRSTTPARRPTSCWSAASSTPSTSRCPHVRPEGARHPRKETAMKKTLLTVIVGAILASAPLAAMARAPSTPAKKPDTMQQHKTDDQAKTKPTSKDKTKDKAKAKHKAKAKDSSKAQKQSASSQLGRDKNLH